MMYLRIRMIFSNLRVWLLPMAIALAVWGCYPDGGLNSSSDFDTVTTFHDTNVNFANITTYAMPDSVIKLIGEGEDPTDEELEELSQFDQLILQKVNQNLQNLGFTRVDETTTEPHVVVLAAVTSSTWTGWAYYPSYPSWGWWGGWGYWPGYGPGWGWGYPGYAVPYQYTTGSVIIDMIDPDNSDPGSQQLFAVWAGALNGLASGGSGNARISNGIDQAFAQSPYLGEGK